MSETRVSLNASFKGANETRCRYRVLMGSAVSGKSVNVAIDLIRKLSMPEFRGCNLLVVRGVEVSHLNSTFAELCGAIERMGLGTVFDTKLNPLTIRNKETGNMVIFRGCNDARAIERLKSVTVPRGKITWVWVEEATELKASDFDIIDDRLRGELPEDHYYQITLTFNPINANHWIKSHLWDIENDDIFKHRSTYLENRFIDVDYKNRMMRRAELDPEGYKIYGLGEWGETGGLVFSNVEIGDYSERGFDHFTMGTDFGWNHCHATLLIGWKDGEPYVLQELVCTEKTIQEIITMLKERDFPQTVMMYCDSADPDKIRELRQAGYRAVAVSKETGLKAAGKQGYVYVQLMWLKERRLYIDGRCPATVKEVQAYKWQKDRETGLYTDEPVYGNDDAIAALRYSTEPIRKHRELKTINKELLGL